MRKLLPTLAVLPLAFLAACGEETTTKRYSVELQPVNGSDARGKADISLNFDEREELRMRLSVRGLEPQQTYQLNMHGFPGEGQRATCPDQTRREIRARTLAEARRELRQQVQEQRAVDTNRNGFLEAREIESLSGPRLLKLTPYPSSDADGEFSFVVTYNARRERTEPLENRALLLTGATTRRGFDPDFIVACGRVQSRAAE